MFYLCLQLSDEMIMFIKVLHKLLNCYFISLLHDEWGNLFFPTSCHSSMVTLPPPPIWLELQCTWTITLFQRIARVIPFVPFPVRSITRKLLFGISLNIIQWYLAQREEVQCTMTIAVFQLITELLPFASFSWPEHYFQNTHGIEIKLGIWIGGNNKKYSAQAP